MSPHLACSATGQGRCYYFFTAGPAQLCGAIIFFGWHQAWGLDLFFEHGRDFIFRGFRAKGKRSVQLIFAKIVCLAGLCCPVPLFFSPGLAGLPGSIILFRPGQLGCPVPLFFFGPGRLGWPVPLFVCGLAKNE